MEISAPSRKQSGSEGSRAELEKEQTKSEILGNHNLGAFCNVNHTSLPHLKAGVGGFCTAVPLGFALRWPPLGT